MGINHNAQHDLDVSVQDKLQSMSTGFQQIPTPCVMYQPWYFLLLLSSVMFKTTCSCMPATLTLCNSVLVHQP